MDEFKIPEGMIEHADIDAVLSVLDKKIEFIKATEPYARREIADLETAHYQVFSLFEDFED